MESTVDTNIKRFTITFSLSDLYTHSLIDYELNEHSNSVELWSNTSPCIHQASELVSLVFFYQLSCYFTVRLVEKMNRVVMIVYKPEKQKL